MPNCINSNVWINRGDIMTCNHDNYVDYQLVPFKHETSGAEYDGLRWCKDCGAKELSSGEIRGKWVLPKEKKIKEN